MAHSNGVMLRNRSAGLWRWRDEVRADGGKKKLRRQVRRREAQEVRKLEYSHGG